ncbi:MAG: hypothetical protein JWQ16_896, partial [Novosphingobium sp.]|nr:hypothetical protein [Novosphingobium sp.]
WIEAVLRFKFDVALGMGGLWQG